MAKHPATHSSKHRARRRAKIIRWSIVGFLMLALGVGVAVGVILEGNPDTPTGPRPTGAATDDPSVVEYSVPASSTIIFPSDEVEFVDPIPVER